MNMSFKDLQSKTESKAFIEIKQLKNYVQGAVWAES